MALTKVTGSVIKDSVSLSGNVSVGGTLTYQDVTNVDALGIGTFRTGIKVLAGQVDVGSNIKLGNAGVITATSFSGVMSGTTGSFSGQVNVGSNIKLGTAGVVTATSFVGSGANLTSLPSQLTLSNNADNRVITGGSGTNLNGEANLTFDGTELKIGGDSSVAGTFGLEVYNTASNEGTALIAGTQGARLDIMDTGSSERIRISASGAIYFISYKSGDDIIFQNTTGSGTAERFRVKTDGIKVTSANANGSAIQMYNTDSSSNVWYVNGEGNSFIGHTYPRTDANLDLGYHSGYRWRDVVLSGGIRFGSANAVNYLNHYQTGQWVPEVIDANGSNYSINYTATETRYVRIGNLVYAYYNIQNTENGSKTGDLVLRGFPFTIRVFQAGGQFWVDHSSPSTGLGDIVGGTHRIAHSSGQNTVYWVKPTDKSGMGYASSRYLQHGQWSYGRWIYGSFMYEIT